MNSIIILLAMNLIYVAIVYAVFRLLTKQEKKKKIMYVAIVLVTAIISWVVAHFLKGVVMHPRPESVYALITPDDTYSFPSGHATFMFSLAYITYCYDKSAGWAIAVLALITGVARVLVGVHYWYDIVGGMLLGCLVSYLAITLLRKTKLI